MVDIHCHIEPDEFGNIDEILEKCKNEGVKKIIVSGYDLKSCNEAIELANNYDMIYATIGYLPEVLQNKENNSLEKLEQLLQNPKVVGIGEIGLDYYWFKDNKEEQKELFIKQINLAKKYNKPIVIHCREAIQDCYDIVEEHDVKAIMHCYSGSLEMAKRFTELGIYISIGGASTFKNSKNIKEVIKEIPLSYIVLETDSPYLTPEPFRGKKNYPYFIPLIAKNIAEIKGISVDEVENTTTNNANRLFDF